MVGDQAQIIAGGVNNVLRVVGVVGDDILG